MKHHLIPRALVVLSCGLPLLTEVAPAQTFRIETKVDGREGSGKARRSNVTRDLKLSAAQKEEIVSIVSSMKNDTRGLRKKLESLREDYRMASLREKTDDKELQRIQQDIMLTKAEINAVAMKKMTEIKQLLTPNQTTKLAELRKAELERIETEQKKARGDVSTDNMPQTPTTRSFTMQSWSSGTDEKYFSPDEVFVYPDRQLWMDSPFGNNFSFSSNGDVDLEELRGFGNFFNHDGNDFSFRMPQFRNFNFRDKQEMEEEENESDLMDDTPHTLPKPKKAPMPPDSPRLKKQVEELREKLKKLEQQLENSDK